MQKPTLSTIIPVLIILSVIVGGLYFLFKPQADVIRQTAPAIAPKAEPPHLTQNEQQTADTADSHQEPGQTLYRKAPMEAVITDPCLETIRELDQFFTYLDKQDYIKEYQFPDGSKDFVASMVNQALSNPPVYQAEKNMTSTLKTGAHLYQVIGAQNLVILATILENEPDHLENIFASFYDWSEMAGQCPDRTYAIRPQLDKLYSYALFFIDSKDGTSYVNRRDTATGLLTRFYALKIIRKAQANHIDKYNVDTTPHINALITDIESSNLLERKAAYLKTLYLFRDQ
jgi:hypothetical protein